MIIDTATSGRYPRLARYLEKDLLEVVKVPAIVQAFRTIGDIGSADLRFFLKSGLGPRLRIPGWDELASMSDERKLDLFGIDIDYDFDPGTTDELYLHPIFADTFEKGAGLVRTRSGRKVQEAGAFVLGALIQYRHALAGSMNREALREQSFKFFRHMYGWNPLPPS